MSAGASRFVRVPSPGGCLAPPARPRVQGGASPRTALAERAMTDAMRGIGADVSKVTLDVQVRPTDARWSVANDEGAFSPW